MKVTPGGYSVKKTVGRTFFAVQVITQLGHVLARTSGKGMVYILYIDIILWLYIPFWNWRDIPKVFGEGENSILCTFIVKGVI